MAWAGVPAAFSCEGASSKHRAEGGAPPPCSRPNLAGALLPWGLSSNFPFLAPPRALYLLAKVVQTPGEIPVQQRCHLWAFAAQPRLSPSSTADAPGPEPPCAPAVRATNKAALPPPAGTKNPGPSQKQTHRTQRGPCCARRQHPSHNTLDT